MAGVFKAFRHCYSILLILTTLYSKMIRSKDIAVIGSGAAGMASALFLHEQGHNVTLFEKVEKPGPVGAGVLLQPAGMFALDQLGVLDKFIETGEIIHRLYGENQNGKKVLNLVYDDFQKGSFGLGIHRGNIFNILHEEVKQKNISYKTGCPVNNLKRLSGKKVELFQDSESLGVFDAMILSSGKNSDLRSHFKVNKKVHDYKWGALWTIVEDDQEIAENELRQVYKTTKNIAGMLPIGKHPETGKKSVSLFWSLRKSRVETWGGTELEHWKEEVCSLYPDLRGLVDKIKTREQVLFASYSHITMKKWHDENLLCIGDAAHAMSPQLGQGVSLGVYDAWSLTQCFNECETIEEAFHEYSRRRKSHIRWMQFVSKLVTPMFQSSGSNWAPYRDATFNIIHNFGFTYRIMLGTLSGVQRGVLRKAETHLTDFLKSMPVNHKH